jgi:hypothetical protein
MSRVSVVIFLFSLFAGCSNNHRQFDQKVWLNDDPASYPLRKSMVADLMANGKLDNQTPASVIELLGHDFAADSTASGKLTSLSYGILTKYGFDIDPQYWEDLKIEFDTTTQKSRGAFVVEGGDQRDFIEKLMNN